MNIKDLNTIKDLLLQVNSHLAEESKYSEASLHSFETLTPLVKELRTLKIPKDEKIIEFSCASIIDEVGQEKFQLASKRIIEQCDFFFEKYNSSALSKKYSFKNLEELLKNKYYSPHFRAEEAEAQTWGRIYNEQKDNPDAVQEELLYVLQKVQETNEILSKKMSEALLIYNEQICSIISDPYNEVVKHIRPLYTVLKNGLEVESKQNPGRPPKEKIETIYQYFIAATDYDQLKERLCEFFKYREKKASPLDMQSLFSNLASRGFLSKQGTSIEEFAELLVQDTGKEIYKGSIKAIYQKTGRVTDGFEQALKEWLEIIRSNKKP